MPAAKSGTYCTVAVPLVAVSGLDAAEAADELEVAVEVVPEAGALAVTEVVDGDGAVLELVPP